MHSIVFFNSHWVDCSDLAFQRNKKCTKLVQDKESGVGYLR